MGWSWFDVKGWEAEPAEGCSISELIWIWKTPESFRDNTV